MTNTSPSTKKLGPLRSELLETWGNHAKTVPTGEYHDFGPSNRNIRVNQRLETFIQQPSETTFRDLWSPDALRDAVVGGPSLALKDWSGTMDELADQFREMQLADQYNPHWEKDFTVKTAIWELYGNMDPATRPILNSTVNSGLTSFGFDKPDSYSERDGYEAFLRTYEDVVGHATKGTDHEVPRHIEIEQFLAMLAQQSRHEIYESLSLEKSPPRIVGWEAEGQAARITFRDLDPLLEEYVSARAGGAFGQEDTGLWGDWWESWKWTHARHVKETVFEQFEPTDINSDDLDAFLSTFKNAPDVELSSSVPIFLLGGRSGGILWSNFIDYSMNKPQESAVVLSGLFDESLDLNHRLTQFKEHYASLDTTGGPLLSLATMFLMFSRPQKYVMYKYGKFKSFFGAYSDYEVTTGFDQEQYWVLNQASRRILRQMEPLFDSHDELAEQLPSMLDIHTLIWVSVGVEDL